MLGARASLMSAAVDEHDLEVGRFAVLDGAAEQRRDLFSFLWRQWRGEVAAEHVGVRRPGGSFRCRFMCKNRPSMSWRLAGTTRLSINDKSKACNLLGTLATDCIGLPAAAAVAELAQERSGDALDIRELLG